MSQDKHSIPPEAEGRPRGAGWRRLRRDREASYKLNFEPLRQVVQRSELVASMVELFFSALAGVSQMQLGKKEDPLPGPDTIEVDRPIKP